MQVAVELRVGSVHRERDVKVGTRAFDANCASEVAPGRPLLDVSHDVGAADVIGFASADPFSARSRSLIAPVSLRCESWVSSFTMSIVTLPG